MKTLRYTENEYVDATKNIWRKLPDEFKVFNLPRDEEGYIIGGIVDEDSAVEPGAIIVGQPSRTPTSRKAPLSLAPPSTQATSA